MQNTTHEDRPLTTEELTCALISNEQLSAISWDGLNTVEFEADLFHTYMPSASAPERHGAFTFSEFTTLYAGHRWQLICAA